MKKKDNTLNIIMYVIIGLIVIVGIVFFIPEGKEEVPTNNTVKPEEPDITFTTNDTMINLKKGETKKINYNLSGNYNINWFSSNSSVATVSNDVVTAVGGGTAKITGTVNANGKIKSISINVEVEKEEEPPAPPAKPKIEKLIISSNKISVVVGENKKIEYRIEPTDGEVTSVKWASDDPKIAEVDDNGNVTGVKEGNTVITLNINDILIGKITVKVKPKITGLTLKSSNSLSLRIGNTSQISVETEPKNANVDITYKSNNSHVTVSNKGLIKAVSKGSSVVTVTAGKYSKTINVSVLPQTGIIDGTGIFGYTDSKVVTPVRANTNFFSNLAKKGVGKMSGNVYTYSKYSYDIERSTLSCEGRNSLVRIYYPQGVDLSTVNTFTFIGGSGERNLGGYFSSIERNTSLIRSGGIVILVSARSSYHYQDAINATEFVKAIVKQKSGVKNAVAGYSMGGPDSGKAMIRYNYDKLIICMSYVDSSDLDGLKDKEIYIFSPRGDSMVSRTKPMLDSIRSKGGFKNVTLITNNGDLINNYSSSMLVVNPGDKMGTGHTWDNFTKANLFAFACK